MNNHIEYTTEFRITAPKLWGADLFCNIAKETDKAFLLINVVQDTDIYGDGEKGMMLSERWLAKSQITKKSNELKKWCFDYLHLLNGRPAGHRNHKEVE